MKVRQTFELVIGSFVVYGLVVACSSDGVRSSIDDVFDASAPTRSFADAVADALADPEASAMAAGFQSGTRLKARAYRSADGAKQFFGWFDSARSEECAFQLAHDGSTRCLPKRRGVNVFRDPGCTQGLLGVKKGTTPPPETYAEIDDHVYEVGAKATVGATVYQGSPGACSGDLVSSIFPSTDFYALGAEVPVASFVSAEIVTDP